MGRHLAGVFGIDVLVPHIRLHDDGGNDRGRHNLFQFLLVAEIREAKT
jgi:hypothetical protein